VNSPRRTFGSLKASARALDDLIVLGQERREGAATAAAANHGLETNLNRSSCQIQDRAPLVLIQAKQLKFLHSRPPAVMADYGFILSEGFNQPQLLRIYLQRSPACKVYHLFYCLKGRSA
jgi:hypothetical protein